EDYPVGTGNAPLYAMQQRSGFTANVGVDPGGVEANLLAYSQQPETSPWVDTRVTVTSPGTTNPYGGTDTRLVAATAVSNTHLVGQDVSGCFDGLNYSFSVFLKPNVRKRALLKIGNTAETEQVLLQVDCAAGTIIAESVTGAGVFVAADD